MCTAKGRAYNASGYAAIRLRCPGGREYRGQVVRIVLAPSTAQWISVTLELSITYLPSLLSGY